MKTELQIRRKFFNVKKEREGILRKRKFALGRRLPATSIKYYDEAIEKKTGFLEALNWIRK